MMVGLPDLCDALVLPDPLGAVQMVYDLPNWLRWDEKHNISDVAGNMNNTADGNSSIAVSHEYCDRLEQEIAELHVKLKWLEKQLRLGQQRLFGASSERSDEAQLQLFSEADSSPA